MKIRNDNYFTYIDTKIKKYENFSEIVESPKSRVKTSLALEPIKKACAEKTDNIVIKKNTQDLLFYEYLNNRVPTEVTLNGLEDNLEHIGLEMSFKAIPVSPYRTDAWQLGVGSRYFAYSNPSLVNNSSLGDVDNYYQSYNVDKRGGLFSEIELESMPQVERDRTRYVYGGLERYTKSEKLGAIENPYHFKDFMSHIKSKMQALYDYPETFNHNKETREIIKKFIELTLGAKDITDEQYFILKGCSKFSVGVHSHHCDAKIVRNSTKEPLSDFIDRLGKVFGLTEPKKTFKDSSTQTDVKTFINSGVQTDSKTFENFTSQTEINVDKRLEDAGNLEERQSLLASKHFEDDTENDTEVRLNFNVVNPNVQRSISCYQKMVSFFCPKTQ